MESIPPPSSSSSTLNEDDIAWKPKEEKSTFCSSIDETIQQHVDEATDNPDNVDYRTEQDKQVPTLGERLQNGYQTFKNVEEDVRRRTQNIVLGGKRPDIRYLGFLIGLGIVGVGAYLLSHYVLNTTNLPFSIEEFLIAKLIPESKFSIHQLSEVRNEANSIKEWLSYFQSEPFSPENMGRRALTSGVIFIQIFSFIAIYLVPPFVMLYILWFVLKYWKEVIRAVWGFTLFMYRYVTELIQCILARRWYIQMITGWSTRCGATLGQRLRKWRRQYIDRPLDRERFAYQKLFRKLYEKYYLRPRRKYILIPYQRYRIHWNYWWRLIFQRVPDVIYQLILNLYARFFLRPRDAIYRWIYGQDESLRNRLDSLQNSLDRLRGKRFQSETKLGRECYCPPRKTTLGTLEENTKTIANDAKETLNEISTVADETRRRYRQFTEHKKDMVSCTTLETAYNNNPSFAKGILVLLFLTLGVVGLYSSIWGVPVSIRSLFANGWLFSRQGTRIVYEGLRTSWFPYLFTGGLLFVTSMFAFMG